jgi:hypothetical protein
VGVCDTGRDDSDYGGAYRALSWRCTYAIGLVDGVRGDGGGHTGGLLHSGGGGGLHHGSPAAEGEGGHAGDELHRINIAPPRSAPGTVDALDNQKLPG